MQNASAEFAALHNAPRNKPGKLRVAYGIIESTIAPVATVTSTSQASWSDVRDVTKGLKVKNDYLGLDRNRFVLGMGGEPIPASAYKKTGFTSFEMSNASGTFTTNPKITITIPTLKSILGLTISFDEFDGSWCEFTVRAYNGASLVKTLEVVPTAWNVAVESSFDNWNKLEIELTKTSYPYRKARMTKLDFGIFAVIGSADTLTATWRNSVSPVSDQLPNDLFIISFTNFDKAYRPGQSTGIQAYVMQEQPITFEWGYELDDGTTEWVIGGNYITTGKITFPPNQVVIEATNTLLYCTDVYFKGVYAAATLYALAEAVLNDASIPLQDDGTKRWKLWEGLKNYTTAAPLPKLHGRDLLMLIANCAGCTLYCDRQGNINIQPLPTTQHDLVIDYNLLTGENAEPTQNPPLYSVQVSIGSYRVEASSEIHSSTRNVLGTETFTIDYSESTAVTVVVTGGTLVSSTAYASCAVIQVTASGVVTIKATGQKLTRSASVYEKIYGQTGQILPWDNVLCTDSVAANRIATFVGDFYFKRTVYKSSFYGHILIDPFDRIWVENDFENKVSGQIIENNTEFNGAWKGSLIWSR